MQSLYGILLGFMVAPCLASLICAFAYADRALGTSRSDVYIGVALGTIAVFAVVAVAIKFGFPR